MGDPCGDADILLTASSSPMDGQMPSVEPASRTPQAVLEPMPQQAAWTG